MGRVIAVLALTALIGAPSMCPAAQEGDVMMVDFLLLRIRCPAAGYSVAERAEIIQKRVNDLLVLGGFDLDTIRVVESGNTAALYANNRLIVTVDECMARMNNTTPAGLARVWAERLRDIYPKAVPVTPPAADPTAEPG